MKEDWEEQEKVSGWPCKRCGNGDKKGLGRAGKVSGWSCRSCGREMKED